MFRLIALLVAFPSLALAQDVEVAVGDDGRLATFRHLPSDADPTEVDPDCADCPVVVSHDTRVDLGDWAQRDETLVLGLTLRAASATATQLFVGVVGQLEVYFDGERVAHFDRGREREDDRRVRLAMTPGMHRLVLRLRKPVRRRGVPVYRWRLRARFLDDRMQPGFGDAVASLGTLSEDDAARAAREAIALEESYGLDSGTPTATLRLSAPSGGVDVPVECALGDTRSLQPTDGVWTDALQADVPLTRGARLPDVLVGGETRRVRTLGLARPLLNAMGQIAARTFDEDARGPMQWRLEEMQRAIDERDPDSRWRSFLVSDTRRQLRSRSPFASPRGYQRMAHVSRLDGSAQPYELFVPPAYRRARAWPVLITLHGFKGNAGDYFRNTFGLARDWRGGETLDAHGRHGTEPTDAPMIVIGPQGRGQTMYRQAGEIDILEALADVERRYNVDPRRVYITGGSMGGTGAAYLPFRHPGRFAAAAALAGYHDQRVRQDTHHAGLTAVERFLQARRSDVDWTENAQDLPMLLVRGTRDRPLEWTRVQVERLRELGFRHEHREPELGHNVWTETYAEGAIFQWLGRYRRPRRVRRLRFRTARERTHTHRWLRIDARSASDVFASVDARASDGAVTLTTEHTDGVTLLDSAPVEGEVAITLDGQSFRATLPASFHRNEGRWLEGALDLTGRKRAGVSGPIRDVYHEPLVFVVGTGDETHTAMNRRVAEHWAHPPGWDVRYPIVEDHAVTSDMIADKTLVLIGPPRSNALVARWRRQLPIRFDGDAIVLRGQRHRGAQVGTVFVAPNPDVPDHSILVIAGTTPLGTWRSRFLPDVLADYVIFDEHVENARGQWSCGGARRDDGSPNGAEPVECRYRAHGFFDAHWR